MQRTMERTRSLTRSLTLTLLYVLPCLRTRSTFQKLQIKNASELFLHLLQSLQRFDSFPQNRVLLPATHFVRSNINDDDEEEWSDSYNRDGRTSERAFLKNASFMEVIVQMICFRILLLPLSLSFLSFFLSVDMFFVFVADLLKVVKPVGWLVGCWARLGRTS